VAMALSAQALDLERVGIIVDVAQIAFGDNL
jgi:hypothetical protein